MSLTLGWLSFRGQIVHILAAKLSGHGTSSSFQRGSGAARQKSRVTVRESRELSTDFCAGSAHTVTCVPTSTTRPVGIWKKSVASLADFASAMNR